MPTFSYIAVDNAGNTINNSVEQADRNEVINSLIKQGLRPISVKEAEKKVVKTSAPTSRKRIKVDQLVMFTRQLSAMISAGVPILRALSALSEHVSDSPALKSILSGVIKEIEGGATFGDALGKYPTTFNDIYVNMVRAGEAAGILDDVLKRLALQQEKSSKMRKKIKSAMMYPMVLMVITFGAFFGLMLFVVPMIEGIVKDLGGEDARLPVLTEVMIGISHFMVNYWYVFIFGIGLLIYGTLLYIKTPSGKYNFHRLILSIPVLKKVIVKIVIARFTRTFSALVEAGVPVLAALTVTSRAVGNRVYEKAIMAAEEEVKNGKTLSIVIGSNPIFPPIVAQMLSVGEETGQTDKVLVKVADFYEEEVDMAIEGLGAIIEPVMIVIMGTMVGLIAASVMLPIAGMATSIKG